MLFERVPFSGNAAEKILPAPFDRKRGAAILVFTLGERKDKLIQTIVTERLVAKFPADRRGEPERKNIFKTAC